MGKSRKAFITITDVENLAPGEIVHDTKVPGFAVRYRKRCPVFVINFRKPDGSRVRNRVVAKYGVLSVEQAREEAKKQLARVTLGKRLKTKREKRKEAAKKADQLTFGELCDQFVEQYAKVNRKSWETDLGRIERHLKPAFGDLAAVEVTRTHLVQLNARIGREDCGRRHCLYRRKAKAKREASSRRSGNGKRENISPPPCKGHPVEANRTIRLVQRVFEIGRDLDLVPGDHSNPAARFGTYRFKETLKVERGDRSAEPEEIRRLVPEIWKVRNRLVRGVFWVAILTGMRKSEVLGLQWADLNLSQRTKRLASGLKLPPRSLILPSKRTKKERLFILPLPTLTVELFRALRPELDEESPSDWVFPSDASKTGHLVAPDDQWRQVRARAKVPKLTLHDLRATVATWAHRRGEHDRLINAMLNQVPPKNVLGVYIDTSPERVREAFEDHAAEVLSAAKVGSAVQLIDKVQEAARVVNLDLPR